MAWMSWAPARGRELALTQPTAVRSVKRCRNMSLLRGARAIPPLDDYSFCSNSANPGTQAARREGQLPGSRVRQNAGRALTTPVLANAATDCARAERQVLRRAAVLSSRTALSDFARPHRPRTVSLFVGTDQARRGG